MTPGSGPDIGGMFSGRKTLESRLTGVSHDSLKALCQLYHLSVSSDSQICDQRGILPFIGRPWNNASSITHV